MSEIRLGAVESKFADIIWNNEPLRPVELEKLAEAESIELEADDYFNHFKKVM